MKDPVSIAAVIILLLLFSVMFGLPLYQMGLGAWSIPACLLLIAVLLIAAWMDAERKYPDFVDYKTSLRKFFRP